MCLEYSFRLSALIQETTFNHNLWVLTQTKLVALEVSYLSSVLYDFLSSLPRVE